MKFEKNMILKTNDSWSGPEQYLKIIDVNANTRCCDVKLIKVIYIDIMGNSISENSNSSGPVSFSVLEDYWQEVPKLKAKLLGLI